jgi:hypothetical protein
MNVRAIKGRLMLPVADKVKIRVTMVERYRVYWCHRHHGCHQERERGTGAHG